MAPATLLTPHQKFSGGCSRSREDGRPGWVAIQARTSQVPERRCTGPDLLNCVCADVASRLPGICQSLNCKGIGQVTGGDFSGIPHTPHGPSFSRTESLLPPEARSREISEPSS